MRLFGFGFGDVYDREQMPPDSSATSMAIRCALCAVQVDARIIASTPPPWT